MIKESSEIVTVFSTEMNYIPHINSTDNFFLQILNFALFKNMPKNYS